jgi:hypothetical protein
MSTPRTGSERWPATGREGPGPTVATVVQSRSPDSGRPSRSDRTGDVRPRPVGAEEPDRTDRGPGGGSNHVCETGLAVPREGSDGGLPPLHFVKSTRPAGLARRPGQTNRSLPAVGRPRLAGDGDAHRAQRIADLSASGSTPRSGRLRRPERTTRQWVSQGDVTRSAALTYIHV